jgi:hypothetical protein
LFLDVRKLQKIAFENCSEREVALEKIVPLLFIKIIATDLLESIVIDIAKVIDKVEFFGIDLYERKLIEIELFMIIVCKAM